MFDADVYAVTATTRTGKQLPTFYLMADVQGITDELHALAIARRMLGDLGHDDAHVFAVATSFNAHQRVSV